MFDGGEVHGHSIEVDLVVDTLGPFQDAVASVGQLLEDEATTTGQIATSIRRLTALRLVNTFDGSFGLRLGGPEPEVQLTFLTDPETTELDQIGSLFEKSVARVLDVLAAATTEDSEQGIIEEIANLGSRRGKTFGGPVEKPCA